MRMPVAHRSPAQEPITPESRSRRRTRSGQNLHARSVLAAPFVLSLILTFVLGPGTINSRHGSFIELALVSAVAALLMLIARPRLLIPVGVATFIVFPVSAGLGFHFAPDWARPLVVVIFYGSMVASVSAAGWGTAAVARRWSRRARLAAAVATGAVLGGIGLVAFWALGSTPSDQTSAAGGAAVPAVNMGSVINTSHRESEPSFTADGRTMYFNCDDYDICVAHLNSTWEQGQWTTPQQLGPPISTAYIDVEPSLNPAGDTLYFTSTRPFGDGDTLPGLAPYINALGRLTMLTTDRLGVSLFGGLGEDDVWVSELAAGSWSVPRNLDDVSGEPPVNTTFSDHCLSFSAGGNEAFWTSTRPGGLGGNDIWTSRRVDGQWTRPENLGASVNGPGSDHHSIPAPDGRALYITSDRTGGLGGNDIYVATRAASGQWGRSINAGRPLNGPGDDRCAAWTPDGKFFLFDSDRAGGHGNKDLWWVQYRDRGR